MRYMARLISRRVLLVALGSVMARGTAQGGDIAVVVRPDVPVTNLTFAELRHLVLGDRQFWTSNVQVTLLVRAPGARERDIILKTVCQMSEAQFRQYWIAKVFRAEAASGPKIVYSNEMAAEMVNAMPGAVAFMDADQVPTGVKVVKVNGLLPGSKDYPLH
jgi:hypothetical protein